MRRIRLVFPVLAAALLFAACSGGNGTSQTTAMPAVNAQGPVSPDNNNPKFSQGSLAIPSVTESVPCPNALDLTFGGPMAYRAHTVTQQKRQQIAVHTTLDGLTATDSAGNKYTFKGVGNAQVQIPNGGTLKGVGVGNGVAVGSGPDAGVRAHVKVDIGVDSTGNITLTFSKVDITCH